MVAKRALAALSLTLLAAGCVTATEPPAQSPQAGRSTERASATPRLALSYDGGVLVLDAVTLQQAADIPMDGFVRLN